MTTPPLAVAFWFLHQQRGAKHGQAVVVGRYWMHLRRVMGAVHRWANQRSTLWDEHLAIAQAINAGDADRATLLTEQHIQRAKDNLVIQLRDKLSKEGIDKAA